jgi:hypothetical protein
MTWPLSLPLITECISSARRIAGDDASRASCRLAAFRRDISVQKCADPRELRPGAKHSRAHFMVVFRPQLRQAQSAVVIAVTQSP